MHPIHSLRSWLMVALGGLISLIFMVNVGGLAQVPTPQNPTEIPPESTPAVVYQPPDRGMPGNREGGGARGCAQETYDPPLLAIMPEENVGRTAMDRPTLFWVAPAVPGRSLIFNINTTEENTFFQQEFQGLDQAQISGITLPETAPALQEGQDYHWYLSLVCDPLARSGDVVVDGWIRRVALDPQMQAQLNSTTLGDLPVRLAQAGLWYDALAALDQLRVQQPQDPVWRQVWSELLRAVNLEQVADLPWSTTPITAFTSISGSSHLS